MRDSEAPPTRRDWLRSGIAAAVIAGMSTGGADAKDYGSRREALDDMDRLAAVCGMRLGMIRAARSGSGLLVTRFLDALRAHRATRERLRERFGLAPGKDPGEVMGAVDADLAGLRQALDDLMNAYAEGLPVFGNADAVAKLARDMVEVSRLRTVIDLWVVAEAA